MIIYSEHHHHEELDLFPDDRHQTPFGTGTSIQYNYLDYRFKNNTGQEFQLLIHTTDEYLCGEIRTTKELPCVWKIEVEGERFIKIENHAKVMYEI